MARQQDRWALLREAHVGDRRVHGTDEEHELGAERVDIEPNGRIDIVGRHVHEVERPEHDRSELRAPGAVPADLLGRDADGEAGGRVRHGRELRARTHVGLRQLLEELGSAAFDDLGGAFHHQVVLHAVLAALGLDRQRHPGVAPDVADLLILHELADHDVIAVESYPDDRHVRAPVAVDGHEMGETPGLDHGTHLVAQLHGSSSAPPDHRSLAWSGRLRAPGRVTRMRTDEPSTLSARTATKADLDGLAESLTRAFEDDPIWRWLVPDDRHWARSVPYVFRHAAREQLPHETVWVTPDLAAAAIWAEPGHRPSALRELLAAPKMATVFRRRSLAGMRLEAAMRAGRPTEPHWYLAVLGTDPAHQGQGYGSAVLRTVLQRCDDTATGAYLESSKETNIPYYRRHGFEVIGELQPIEAMPPLYRMWRDPRSVDADAERPD